jgi:hypothetical protein
MKKIHIIVAFVIALIAVIGYRVQLAVETANQRYDTEVHVHADFAVYMNGDQLDFSQTGYQSSVSHEKDEDVHLHDGDGKVVHRHAEGVTFAQLLKSIGYELGSDCFTTDTKEQYCTNASSTLAFYVNGTPADKTTYIPQEEDQILLTYGPTGADVKDQLASITDESCIHTGTCPERGVAPLESCGLTCDVTLSNQKITLKEILTFVFLNHF